MSSRLNREAFERIVAEDIAWAEAQPRSLERDHLVAILRDSARLYYDVEPAVDARDKTIAERDAEIARLTKERDDANHNAARLKQREQDIIAYTEPADGGQYRADIAGAIKRMRGELDAARAEIARLREERVEVTGGAFVKELSPKEARLILAWRRSPMSLGKLIVAALDRYAVGAAVSLTGIVDASLVEMCSRYAAGIEPAKP